MGALFLPPVEALYPGGITTEVSRQRGTFVEVKGLQDAMEGGSRPGFFRGVATVVLKLFNIVQVRTLAHSSHGRRIDMFTCFQPTRAYFGQKDIQQALLLRRLCTDLHLVHPTPHSLIIHPTHRDATTGLALSSRNAYLTDSERKWSSVLIDALRLAEAQWIQLRGTLCDGDIQDVESQVLEVAKEQVRQIGLRAQEEDGVKLELLYILVNDPAELGEIKTVNKGKGAGAVLSGAVLLGKTRLIDNLVLEFALN